MFINKRGAWVGSKNSSGFTIVELVLFIVVVSVAIAGVLSVMNLTASHSADPQIRKQALSIAEALMEEVSLARFTYCDPADPDAETAAALADCHTRAEGMGPELGNVRPFDNVNDYVTANGNLPIFRDGENNPALNDYTARIAITEQELNGIPATDSLHIRISVLYQGEVAVALDGYRTRYAPRVMP
jgi:MSHA pilin protein MshD